MLTACTYPHASLKKEINNLNQKDLKVVYPTPKTFSYQTARIENTWGIFFVIKDYTQISFPPPGAIIDNRLLYYFALVDNDLNPLIDSPIRFKTSKQKGRNVSGYYYALLPAENSFLAVYIHDNVFYYTSFNLKGKQKGSHKKLYTTAQVVGNRNTILSITYHDNTIYLFILTRPENIYYDTWSINLVKRNIKTEKTEIIKKFITSKNGWYHAKSLQVLFDGTTMHLAWIDGTVHRRNPESRNYGLSSVFYRARCTMDERQCENYSAVYRSKNYADADLRLKVADAGVQLVIKNKKKILIHQEKAGSPSEIQPGTEASYLKLFSRGGDFPGQVTCGPAVK